MMTYEERIYAIADADDAAEHEPRYDEHDLRAMYDDMLDDVYGIVTVAGMEYETSRALRELDPVAYRCGFSDYLSEYDETSDGMYVRREG